MPFHTRASTSSCPAAERRCRPVSWSSPSPGAVGLREPHRFGLERQTDGLKTRLPMPASTAAVTDLQPAMTYPIHNGWEPASTRFHKGGGRWSIDRFVFAAVRCWHTKKCKIGVFGQSAEYRSRPPRVRVTGPKPFIGVLGAKNWELIQPFKRVFSTWTQTPSRLVAVNRVPLGAVPRTGAFPEGADLMFTPGRCKKTRSGFCSEASAVSEAGTSAKEPRRTLRELAQAQWEPAAPESRMTVALLERIRGFCGYVRPWRGQEEVRKHSCA